MKKTMFVSILAAASLAAGCSSPSSNSATTAMTLDQLPQAAQTSIRNAIDDQTIYNIKQEIRNGQTAYKVEVERQGFYQIARPSVIVAQDGSILKESHSLAERRTKMNEAAGAQNTQDSNSMNGNPSAPSGSPQAPSEANPSGTSPSEAMPSQPEQQPQQQQ